MKELKIVLFIPTYNAGSDFETVLKLIKEQSKFIDSVYIIDSNSSDDTQKIAKEFVSKVDTISPKDFGHGKVRTIAAKKFLDYDYMIVMTQDVYLQKNAIENIINFMTINTSCGVVYGKQEVDLKKGNIFEAFSRTFNYPENSAIKSLKDKKKLGIKTIFSSNAFAIYDLKKLADVNFFDENLSFSEDMHVAYKMINNEYSVGYCAEAKVYHTHNYGVKDEYSRYKSIGEFHNQNKYIQDEFGSNNNEGIKLVKNELKFLLKKNKAHLIPESIIRTIFKFLGYKKGLYFERK